jgi:hypothetical protein
MAKIMAATFVVHGPPPAHGGYDIVFVAADMENNQKMERSDKTLKGFAYFWWFAFLLMDIQPLETTNSVLHCKDEFRVFRALSGNTPA